MLLGEVDRDVLELFSQNVVASYSINQIAKKLNKSYPYVNKRVSALLDDGILQKRVVGSAHLCSLNFFNDSCIALLSLVEIEKRDAAIKKNRALDMALSWVKEHPKLRGYECMVVSERTVFLVGDEKPRRKLEGMHQKLISEDQFKNMLEQGKVLKEHVILAGFEAYFMMVREIEAELRLRYGKMS